MKTRIIFALSLITVLLFACEHDKKQIDISEMDDTSFVNTNFSGNLIDYRKGMSAYDNFIAQDMADIYGAYATEIMLSNPKIIPKCQATSASFFSFYVKTEESNFLW